MADTLYGQADLARFCEYVIASLFEVSLSSSTSTRQLVATPAYGREGVDTPPYTPPVEGAPRKEPPILLEFIAYALYRTRLPLSIVHQSLLLLSRLKQRYPAARGTSSSPHRLFLSSLMLSAKISMDDTYSNKSWAIVGSNYFELKEVNQMERELFAFLGWNVVVSKEELDEFVASAESVYVQQMQHHQITQQQQRCSSSPRSSKKRRTEEAAEAAAAAAAVASRENRHRQAKDAARALLRPHTYRHVSPSPSRSSSAAPSTTHSPAHSYTSMPASSTTSPSSAMAMTASSSSSSSHRQHQPQHRYSTRMATASQQSSTTSSTYSSAFPSAAHSPVSPPSAPLSAGPQTPDSDCLDVHPHVNECPDFADAAAYVLAPSSKVNNSNTRASPVYPPAVTSH